MKLSLTSLKFWETAFALSLVLYIIDERFLLSIFYITIPLVFLFGVVASIFAVKNKKYIHAMFCVVGVFLSVCMFVMPQ